MNAVAALQNQQGHFSVIGLVNSLNSTSEKHKRYLVRGTEAYNPSLGEDRRVWLVESGPSFDTASLTFHDWRVNRIVGEGANLPDSISQEQSPYFYQYMAINDSSDDESLWPVKVSKSFNTLSDAHIEVIQQLINTQWYFELGATETNDFDSACSVIREFERLEAGWDGPNSSAPSKDMIEDALAILDDWPVSGLMPEPSVGIDGSIALELYDEDDFIRGSVEIIGKKTAIFSIVHNEKVVCTGRFDTTSPMDMRQALSQFKDHLG